MKMLSKIQELKDLSDKIDTIEQRRSVKNDTNFTLDYNTDGLLVADKNLRIEFCNPALLQLLDYSQEQLCGKDITELMHNDDQKRHIIEDVRKKILFNRKRKNVDAGDSYKICENVVGNIIDSTGHNISVFISVGEIVTNDIQQFICILRKTNIDV